MLDERSTDEIEAFEAKLADRLRAWLDEEGLSSKKEQDDGAVFHYVVHYPQQKGGVRLHLIRPKGRRGLVILLGIHLSEGHAKALGQLGPEEQRRFVHRLRKAAFEDGEIGFSLQVEEGIPSRWQFDRILYDDVISRHTVMTSMRRVFSKHLELVELINLEIGGNGGPGGASATSSEDVKGYL